jgi:hypothetical protein
MNQLTQDVLAGKITDETRETYVQWLDEGIKTLRSSKTNLEYLWYYEKNQELRCVSLVAYILPKEAREEWLGDLRESLCELVNAGYPWWSVSLITWGRVALLFWSLIKVKYQDLGFSKKK